jgi:hypothetical protein
MSEQITKRPLHRLTRGALIASLIVAAVAGAAFFLILMTTGNAFVRGEVSGVYWLYLNRAQTLFVLLSITCAAIWFALMVPGVILKGIDLLERVLLTMVVAILYIALQTLMGPSIGDMRIEYVHHTTLKTDKTVYHSGGVLTTSIMAGIMAELDNSPDSEPVYAYTFQPVVFKCDSRGVVCHSIYHGTYKLYEEPPISTLTTDGTAITLSLNGAVVWEHIVEADSE